MYTETLEAVNELTEKKKRLMKEHPFRYLLSSGLAGSENTFTVLAIIFPWHPL